MKKQLFVLASMMLLSATAFSAVGTINMNESTQSPHRLQTVEWEYTYGGDEFDWLYDIQPTSDGGYIAAGLTEEDDIFYAWVLKIDSDGLEEWSSINYEFNGTEIESDILVHCVRETPDGGYLVGGMGRYYCEDLEDWIAPGFVWKVDASGSTQWLQSIGNESELWYCVPFVFENFDDTGWMCGGLYVEFISSEEFILDAVLFKLGLNGDLLWYESYDLGQDWEWFRSIDEASDGGYYLSGTSLNYPSNLDEGGYVFVKTDDEGTLEWSSVFDGSGFEFSPVMGGHTTSDGGFLTAGCSDTYGAGGTDLWIVKVDSDGNMAWNTTFGGTDNERCYGMDALDDEGYAFIIVDNAFKAFGNKEDTLILTTDDEGKPEWALLIEEEETQWPQSISQTADKGFIVAGRTGSIGASASDGLILKTGPFPAIDIEVSGGIGITATITNNGLSDAEDVPFKVTITGGILGLINTTLNGTMDLAVDESVSFSSGMFLGFGKISIVVQVGVKKETVTGTQMLLFSMVG